MKCWQLNDVADDDLTGPYWCHASTRGQAKAVFARRADIPFIAVSVTRLPVGDDIAIDFRVGLYLGIYAWVECARSGCYRRIYADDEDTCYAEDEQRGLTPGVVDWRGAVYCSPECAEGAAR